MSEDPYALTTIEELRRIIPTSKPQTDALWQRLNDYVDTFSAEFINDSPMVFVGTCSRDGHVDVSLKGDAPGFVVLRDNKTLLLPERAGNTEARGLRNLLEHQKISLLFVVPRAMEVLRVTGSAALTRDPKLLDELSALGKPALICVKITVEECFFHCGRAVNRSHLWNPEKWPAQSGKYQMRQISARKKIDLDKLEEMGRQALKDMGEADGAY